MTDIVTRLAQWAENDMRAEGVALDAKYEIERLRWENANMEKLWGKSEGTWMEIRDKQDAEVERLREALHEIYRKCDNDRIMWMVDEALQQKDSK